MTYIAWIFTLWAVLNYNSYGIIAKPTCRSYQVMSGQPMPHIEIKEELELNVYTNGTKILTEIHLPGAIYKVSVEGKSMTLMKCVQDKSQCINVDTNNSGPPRDEIITPNIYNNLDIILLDGKISIAYNGDFNMMGLLERKDGEEAWLAIIPSGSDKLIVNVKCNKDTVPRTTIIMEAIGTTPVTPADGDGTSTVWIVLGVLAAAILIAAIAVWYRRSRSLKCHGNIMEFCLVSSNLCYCESLTRVDLDAHDRPSESKGIEPGKIDAQGTDSLTYDHKSFTSG